MKPYEFAQRYKNILNHNVPSSKLLKMLYQQFNIKLEAEDISEISFIQQLKMGRDELFQETNIGQLINGISPDQEIINVIAIKCLIENTRLCFNTYQFLNFIEMEAHPYLSLANDFIEKELPKFLINIKITFQSVVNQPIIEIPNQTIYDRLDILDKVMEKNRNLYFNALATLHIYSYSNISSVTGDFYSSLMFFIEEFYSSLSLTGFRKLNKNDLPLLDIYKNIGVVDDGLELEELWFQHAGIYIQLYPEDSDPYFVLSKQIYENPNQSINLRSWLLFCSYMGEYTGQPFSVIMSLRHLPGIIEKMQQGETDVSLIDFLMYCKDIPKNAICMFFIKSRHVMLDRGKVEFIKWIKKINEDGDIDPNLGIEDEFTKAREHLEEKEIDYKRRERAEIEKYCRGEQTAKDLANFITDELQNQQEDDLLAGNETLMHGIKEKRPSFREWEEFILGLDNEKTITSLSKIITDPLPRAWYLQLMIEGMSNNELFSAWKPETYRCRAQTLAEIVEVNPAAAYLWAQCPTPSPTYPKKEKERVEEIMRLLAFGIPHSTFAIRVSTFPALVPLWAITQLIVRSNKNPKEISLTLQPDSTLAQIENPGVQVIDLRHIVDQIQKEFHQENDRWTLLYSKPGWMHTQLTDTEISTTDMNTFKYLIWSRVAEDVGIPNPDTMDELISELDELPEDIQSKFLDGLIQAYAHDGWATKRDYAGIVDYIRMLKKPIAALKFQTEFADIGMNLFDNRTILSCNFGPSGSEKNAILGYLLDEATGIVFIRAITFDGEETTIGAIVYFLAIASIDGKDSKVLLVDSVDSGLVIFNQITPINFAILNSGIFTALNHLCSILDDMFQVEWVLFNTNVNSKVAGEVIAYAEDKYERSRKISTFCKKVRRGDAFHNHIDYPRLYNEVWKPFFDEVKSKFRVPELDFFETGNETQDLINQIKISYGRDDILEHCLSDKHLYECCENTIYNTCSGNISVIALKREDIRRSL